MTEKTKQILDMDVLNKASDKYEETKLIDVKLQIDNEEKTFSLEVYKTFSPIAIKDCAKEYIEKLDIVKSVDKDGFGDVSYPYLMFMIVKHFSKLELPNVFSEQLKAIENMLNTGALIQIFLQFEQSELDKVKTELEFALKTFSKNEKYLKQKKEEIKGQLENKSLVE